MNNKAIPIFFACSIDDDYIHYLDVAIISIIKNASKTNNYEIIILSSNISMEHQNQLTKHSTENIKVKFFDFDKILKPIEEKFTNTSYTLGAYFRFFIANSFPQYDKAIYLDCDIVVLADIAELYNIDLGDNLLAAAYEQNTDRAPMFTNYVEEIIGIPHKTYFNSGVMVMNLKALREFKLQEKFLDMLVKYNFDCLAPDQEYLNVLCHGKVKFLPTGWNKHSFPEPPEGELKLCHYALASKPWHYADTINGEYFWQYAKESEFYDDIWKEFNNFTDADKERDRQKFLKLVEAIEGIKHSDRTFKKLWFDKK